MRLWVGKSILKREFGGRLPAEAEEVLQRAIKTPLLLAIKGTELPARTLLLKAYATSRQGPRRIVLLFVVEQDDLGLRSVRRLKDAIFARPYGFRCLLNKRPMLLQGRTMVRPQFEDREPFPCEILLMPQVLIADDEKVKCGRFSGTQQAAVFQVAPSHLNRRPDVKVWQRLADLNGRADVQTDLHRANSAAIRSHP